MQKTPGDRLKEVRLGRFADASEAARALGISIQTYHQHENGRRPITRAAERYAAFFRVSLDWLMTGRGEMRTGLRSVPVVGLVGAGAAVLPLHIDTAGAGIGEVSFPEAEYLAALEVRGDSQYPRYLDGEVVIYDTRAVSPGQLVNSYAVVDLADGRRLLKMLRRMPSPGRFRLESHNAAPEDDAEITAAYNVVATIAA